MVGLWVSLFMMQLRHSPFRKDIQNISVDHCKALLLRRARRWVKLRTSRIKTLREHRTEPSFVSFVRYSSFTTASIVYFMSFKRSGWIKRPRQSVFSGRHWLFLSLVLMVVWYSIRNTQLICSIWYWADLETMALTSKQTRWKWQHTEARATSIAIPKIPEVFFTSDGVAGNPLQAMMGNVHCFGTATYVDIYLQIPRTTM